MNNQVVLKNHIRNCKKINTHCHHISNIFFEKIGLKEIFGASYIAWCGEKWETKEQRSKLFENLKYRSYFVWLSKSLNELYGLGELCEDNFEAYDKKILENGIKDNNFFRLKNVCNYEKIIQDCYWNYGDNLGDKKLFAPTFRVNIFLNAYNFDFVDQDKCSISKYYEKKITDIDEYIEQLEKIILSKKENGCVALKCAIAYERGINFCKTNKVDAQKILDLPKEKWTQKTKDDFQSYIFYAICQIAAKLDLPLQIHTGLGQIEKTNAINLINAIKDNGKTKFVIFHLSFPHTDDVIALAHNYQNVYPDICWVPLLSYNKAISAIEELIDTTNIDKICWGCDTWTFEESFGAIMAMEYVLCKVLTKKIDDSFITIDEAKNIIDKIFYKNAVNLYDLEVSSS